MSNKAQYSSLWLVVPVHPSRGIHWFSKKNHLNFRPQPSFDVPKKTASL